MEGQRVEVQEKGAEKRMWDEKEMKSMRLHYAQEMSRQSLSRGQRKLGSEMWKMGQARGKGQG